MLPKMWLTGILAAGLACAQGPMGGGMPEAGGRGMVGGGRGVDMPVVPSRPNHLEMISQMLALTRSQKKDVKSILDEGQKEAAPVRERLAKTRAHVAEAIQAGKSQDEIDRAVKDCAAAEARMAAVEMQAFARIYKSLEQDQRSKVTPVFLMMAGIFKGKNWNE